MAKNGAKDTRTAMLEAAAKIFAAKGFHDATVRAICAEAGANIALVSRYFGSQKGLYTGHYFAGNIHESALWLAEENPMPVENFAEFLIRAMPAPLAKLLLKNEIL